VYPIIAIATTPFDRNVESHHHGHFKTSCPLYPKSGHWAVNSLSAPEIFEPRWRQFGIANCVLDIAMAKVGLKGACVVSFVG